MLVLQELFRDNWYDESSFAMMKAFNELLYRCEDIFCAAIEELDVRGQRERDANQAVLDQVGEVLRGCAADAEIVGVDRAEQRIVDACRGHLRQPGLRGCRRELEVLGLHVAVGTGAAIAAQAGVPLYCSLAELFENDRPDGVVLRGAKLHQTGCLNSHWLAAMPTMRLLGVVRLLRNVCRRRNRLRIRVGSLIMRMERRWCHFKRLTCAQ